MKKKIIGRKHELNLLAETMISKQAELLAIYGRRRVGKTFLIREYYKKNFIFEVTGLSKGTLSDQLENFTKELQIKTKDKSIVVPKKWLQAFTLLEQYIEGLSTKNKKVVFIDEFPWMATPRSKFLMAFENFWNHFASKRDDLIIVICGSAASYMITNIVKNRGGLHNRITKKIRLLPFNLNETELFLKHKGIKYTHYDILQLYMAIGGIPHYLGNLKKGDSVAQNIDRLCFAKDGLLNDEFNLLFKSLFKNSDVHMLIVGVLATTRKGINRSELIKKINVKSGGDFTLKLQELIESGFVSEYSYYQNKKKLNLYRLSDEYSLFYLKYIAEIIKGGAGTWQKLFKKPSYKIWSGFSFETVCLKHIKQVKKGLKIDAIYSTNSSWFNKNAQIDLLIDRDDNVINICEMKFYNSPYTINKTHYNNLKNKLSEFENENNTNKNNFLTMITTYGIIQNKYSTEIVENELTMGNLFIE